MYIGWSTQRKLSRGVVGSDEFSIGLDGFVRGIVHDDQTYSQNMAPWKAGDVLGCLIDKINCRFHFTLNGEPITLPAPMPFFSSTQPYYATVSLFPHQHCYFNFGQSRFFYRPKRIEYWDFRVDIKKLRTFRKQLKCLKYIVNSRNASFKDVVLAIESTLNVNGMPLLALKASPFACSICAKSMFTKRFRFECCECPTCCITCAANYSNCPNCAGKLNQIGMFQAM